VLLRISLKQQVIDFNDLFYMDKTMMVFGDAKKVIEDMVKAVE
jgi:NAD/NADP transhydrogenase beta subunit